MSERSSCIEDLNYSECCIAVGKSGYKSDTSRFYDFVLCAGLIAVSAILLCISAIGLSLDGTDKYSWIHGSSTQFIPPHTQGTFDRYAGLSGTVTTWKSTNTTSYPYSAMENEVHAMNWDDPTCTEKCCADCYTASIFSTVMVFISLVATIPTLRTNCQRATAESDTNVEKLFGIVGASVGCISSMLALVVYQFLCGIELPRQTIYIFAAHGETTPVTINFEYSPGIGQICLIIACSFQFVAFVTHILVQTPEDNWERPAESSALLGDVENKLTPEEQEKQKILRELTEAQRKVAIANAKKAQADEAQAASHDKLTDQKEQVLAAHEMKEQRDQEVEDAATKAKREKEERRRAVALQSTDLAPENLPRQSPSK